MIVTDEAFRGMSLSYNVQTQSDSEACMIVTSEVFDLSQCPEKVYLENASSVSE